MADNWVERYMIEKKQGSIKQQADLRMAEIAKDGSPRLFRAIVDRVRSDMDRYHKSGGDKSLRFDFIPSRRFVVSKSSYPAAGLEVELKEATVECRYFFKLDDTASLDERFKHFRIAADLHGNVQAVRNGLPFTDESEISAELLKPVLDYIH